MCFSDLKLGLLSSRWFLKLVTFVPLCLICASGCDSPGLSSCQDRGTASLRAILNTDHFEPILVAGAAVGISFPQGGGALPACLLLPRSLLSCLFYLTHPVRLHELGCKSWAWAMFLHAS